MDTRSVLVVLINNCVSPEIFEQVRMSSAMTYKLLSFGERSTAEKIAKVSSIHAYLPHHELSEDLEFLHVSSTDLLSINVACKDTFIGFDTHMHIINSIRTKRHLDIHKHVVIVSEAVKSRDKKEFQISIHDHGIVVYGDRYSSQDPHLTSMTIVTKTGDEIFYNNPLHRFHIAPKGVVSNVDPKIEELTACLATAILNLNIAVSRRRRISDAYTYHDPKKLSTGASYPMMQNFTTVLSSPLLLESLSILLEDVYRYTPVTKFVGIDARGFVLAGLLAGRLRKGIVLARKSGKCMGKSTSEVYAQGYRTNLDDALEIEDDTVSRSDYVVIVDDVLSSGGSCNAAKTICTRLGAKVWDVMNLKRVNANKYIADVVLNREYRVLLEDKESLECTMYGSVNVFDQIADRYNVDDPFTEDVFDKYTRDSITYNDARIEKLKQESANKKRVRDQ
ncbi:adenine phosphoribosyltransferase [Yasminevirus sp. GU-2018]|uniref:adenine phosphoribosyltransferase n=1 Tax=Yasminevirus sp. GU-2018 TaxID=2420051 RepID=A0A5K0U939_9VIRU|nr:adenine phosphoribosyltransferase [Yasminevirus sp. GU-2018]